MFDSGITVKQCIETIKNEIDIATPYGDDVYLRFVNEVLQLLYSEIIKEERVKDIGEHGVPTVNLDDFCSAPNEITFERITKLYVNDKLLSKSTISNAAIFPNIYYKNFEYGLNNQIGFSVDKSDNYKVIIYYNAVPALYYIEDNTIVDNGVKIPLPYEWLSLVISKVKGEIYKLVNEDNQAAKWLNEFNNQIESFKMWCANHYNSYLSG